MVESTTINRNDEIPFNDLRGRIDSPVIDALSTYFSNLKKKSEKQVEESGNKIS